MFNKQQFETFNILIEEKTETNCQNNNGPLKRKKIDLISHSRFCLGCERVFIGGMEAARAGPSVILFVTPGLLESRAHNAAHLNGFILEVNLCPRTLVRMQQEYS